MARIYVASSWRNPYQPGLVKALRTDGHAVYDFRADTRKRVEPVGEADIGRWEPPATAFSWAEMDTAWEQWTPAQYRHLLQTSPRAAQGYIGDLRGMEWADTCVVCLPCGNSAHLEAGYMKGRGKRVIFYWEKDERVTSSGPQRMLPNGNPAPMKTWTFEPDLMYLLGDNLCIGWLELSAALIHGETK